MDVFLKVQFEKRDFEKSSWVCTFRGTVLEDKACLQIYTMSLRNSTTPFSNDKLLNLGQEIQRGRK